MCTIDQVSHVHLMLLAISKSQNGFVRSCGGAQDVLENAVEVAPRGRVESGTGVVPRNGSW